MTKLFQNFDQFKDVTLSISKHLKNTKVGVLREAVAKAQGYSNVPAYKASFEDYLANLPAVSVFPDPNTFCRREGNVIFFQARIDIIDDDAFENDDDEFDEVMDEEGNSLTPEEAREALMDKVDISESQWKGMSAEEKREWQEHVSEFWCGENCIVGIEPVEIGDEHYAQGMMFLNTQEDYRKIIGVIARFFKGVKQESYASLFARTLYRLMKNEICNGNSAYAKSIAENISGAQNDQQYLLMSFPQPNTKDIDVSEEAFIEEISMPAPFFRRHITPKLMNGLIKNAFEDHHLCVTRNRLYEGQYSDTRHPNPLSKEKILEMLDRLAVKGAVVRIEQAIMEEVRNSFPDTFPYNASDVKRVVQVDGLNKDFDPEDANTWIFEVTGLEVGLEDRAIAEFIVGEVGLNLFEKYTSE